MTDEKLEKFESLAEKRVAEVIKKIHLIGNLASKNNYHYTDKHVKQIFDALDAAVKASKERFRQQQQGDSQIFKFK